MKRSILVIAALALLALTASVIYSKHKSSTQHSPLIRTESPTSIEGAVPTNKESVPFAGRGAPAPLETAASKPLESMWTDPATGITWTTSDNGKDIESEHKGAPEQPEPRPGTDYCQSLRLAGHSDWRLPTIDELKSIYNPKISIPGRCCGGTRVFWHVKGNLQLSGLELSSTLLSSTTVSRAFNFAQGEEDTYLSDQTGPFGQSGLGRALCVRDSGN